MEFKGIVEIKATPDVIYYQFSSIKEEDKYYRIGDKETTFPSPEDYLTAEPNKEERKLINELYKNK